MKIVFCRCLCANGTFNGSLLQLSANCRPIIISKTQNSFVYFFRFSFEPHLVIAPYAVSLCVSSMHHNCCVRRVLRIAEKQNRMPNNNIQNDARRKSTIQAINYYCYLLQFIFSSFVDIHSFASYAKNEKSQRRKRKRKK